VVGIFFLSVFPDLIIYIPFAIVYAMVAKVHLSNTGFCLAARATQEAFNSERVNLAAHQPQNRQFFLQTAIPLHLPLLHPAGHQIVPDPNGAGGGPPYSYVLHAHGVLEDMEINEMLTLRAQTPANSVVVFEAGRRLQVQAWPLLQAGQQQALPLQAGHAHAGQA
jgi:hypothetical protein